MKRNHKLIKIDGKTYQKSSAFGNRDQKSIFKNKAKYDRKQFKSADLD